MAIRGRTIRRALVWFGLCVASAIACGGSDSAPSDAGKGPTDASSAVDGESPVDARAALDAGDPIDAPLGDGGASDADAASPYGYVRRFPYHRGKGSAKATVLLRSGATETAVVAGFSTDGWIAEFPLENPGALTYRTLTQSRFKAMIATQAGGIALAGATREGDGGAAPSYPFAMLMDSSRSIVWQKHLGTQTGTGSAYALAEGPMGDLFIAASARVGGPNGFDTRVLRLRSNGSVIWEKTYGAGSVADAGKGLSPGSERPVSVLPLADGSAIVVASTNASFGSGKEDVWVFRVGPTGDVVWQNAYGGPKSEIAFGATLASDGSRVYVTGSTDSFGPGAGDLWFLALDAQTGALASQQAFGTAARAEEGRSVTLLEDGGLVVVGSDSNGLIALRLDADLGVLWQRKYRNMNAFDGWAYGTNTFKAPDEGFFFLGGGLERGWVIRTASDGSIGGCATPGFGTVLPATTFVSAPTNATAQATSVAPTPRNATVFDLGKPLVDVATVTSNACE